MLAANVLLHFQTTNPHDFAAKLKGLQEHVMHFLHRKDLI